MTSTIFPFHTTSPGTSRKRSSSCSRFCTWASKTFIWARHFPVSCLPTSSRCWLTALQLRVSPTWTTISSCSCRRSSPDWGAQSRRDAFFIPFLALRTAGRNFTADRRSLGLSRLCRQAPGRISHIWRSAGAFRRARASRCRQPDGRLRDRGRRDAPRRRVVLGWARPHPGADGCLCGPDGGTGGAVLHPGSASVGHDRLSEYGGCPRCRQRRNLRLVGKVAPASKGGSVTGLVGAAGGLGGFLPPLVRGYIHGKTGPYGWD